MDVSQTTDMGEFMKSQKIYRLPFLHKMIWQGAIYKETNLSSEKIIAPDYAVTYKSLTCNYYTAFFNIPHEREGFFKSSENF